MEQESDDEARSEVQNEVDGSGDDSRFQTGAELFAGVFQPEHEQQEENADLRANPVELFTYFKGRNAALAKCESSYEIKRNGGDAIALRKSSQNGQSCDDQSEFNEERR